MGSIIYDILTGNDYTIEELGNIKTNNSKSSDNQNNEKKLTFSDYIDHINE